MDYVHLYFRMARAPNCGNLVSGPERHTMYPSRVSFVCAGSAIKSAIINMHTTVIQTFKIKRAEMCECHIVTVWFRLKTTWLGLGKDHDLHHSV